MSDPTYPGSKPRPASAGVAAGAILVAALAVGGCTPAEYESIDITKSKAIAAEKGIGPQGGAEPLKKARPRAVPNAPAAR